MSGAGGQKKPRVVYADGTAFEEPAGTTASGDNDNGNDDEAFLRAGLGLDAGSRPGLGSSTNDTGDTAAADGHREQRRGYQRAGIGAQNGQDDAPLRWGTSAAEGSRSGLGSAPVHPMYGGAERPGLGGYHRTLRRDDARAEPARPPPRFGTRTTTADVRKIGSFEAHTTGFGSKMLRRMGWAPGEGLGKERQGIAVPVTVEVGKGAARGGVGTSTAKMKVGSKADEKKVRRGRRIDANDDDDDDDEGDGNGSDSSGGQRRRMRSSDEEDTGDGDDFDIDEEGAAMSDGSDMGRLDAALQRRRKRERKRERDIMRDEIERRVLGGGAGSGHDGASSSAGALPQDILDQLAASRFPPADELAARAESLAAGAERSRDMLRAGLKRDAQAAKSYEREIAATKAAMEECERDARAFNAVAEALEACAAACSGESINDGQQRKQRKQQQGSGAEHENGAGTMQEGDDEPLRRASFDPNDRIDAERAVLSACEAVSGPLSAHPAASAECSAAAAALAEMRPLLASVMRGWLPEAEPSRGAALFGTVARALFGTGLPATETRPARDPEHPLLTAAIEELVVPAIAEYARTRWDPADPTPMCAVAEAWRCVWPVGVKSSFYRDIVAPRLMEALSADQRHPPHVWIHPWLPLAGTRRLGEVLRAVPAWLVAFGIAGGGGGDSSRDGSHSLRGSDVPRAVASVKPWVGLLDLGDVHRAVARRATRTLMGSAPLRERFRQVVPWLPPSGQLDDSGTGLVPFEDAMELMHVHFFPRWHRELRSLCAGGSGDHSKLCGTLVEWYTQWCLGPGALIPEAWRRHASVRFHLSHAARAMTSVAGRRGDSAAADPPPAYPPFATFASPAAADAEKKGAKGDDATKGRNVASSASGSVATGDFAAVTLREAVEELAADRGVDFVPAGRTPLGKHLFEIAGRKVYFDGDLMYAAGEGGAGFEPVSVHALIPA